MEIGQIVSVLTGTPLSLVLLYLLIQANKELAEVRRDRDADARMWVERFALQADKIAAAVERLDLPGPM